MFGQELIQLLIIFFLICTLGRPSFKLLPLTDIKQLQILSFMCEDKDWRIIDLAFFFSPCRVPEVLHGPLYRLHAQLADQSVGGRGRG